MDLETMYKGIAFSPVASLVEDIGAGDTTIKVDSTSGFPQAPNYATIGTDEQAETIYYGGMTGDTLSGCRRGVEGVAKEWQTGELVGRNFTNKDYETLIANINNLNTGKWETPSAQTKDNFIMFDDNGKPVDSGKKASDFDASGAAEKVNETLGNHTGNNTIHISDSERQKWNGAVTDKHTHTNKAALDRITQEKITSWDKAVTDMANKADKTDLPNKVVSVSLIADSWVQSSEGIYTQAIANESIKDNMKLNLSFTGISIVKTLSDAGVTGLMVENNAGTASVIAYGEKPSVAIPVQIELVEIKAVN